MVKPVSIAVTVAAYFGNMKIAIGGLSTELVCSFRVTDNSQERYF
jgi:hypothetical protein